MVYAMKSSGRGLPAMARFCSTMNMPPPICQKPYNYRTHTKAILRAFNDVAERTNNDAAQGIYNFKILNR